MPYTPNTTWVDGSGGATPLSAARLNNMEAGISPVYFAFTPVWSSSGTAVSLGNGTIAGSYVQIGKFVHGRILLTMGSTTTFGTGNYFFTLPVAGSGPTNNSQGTANLLDSSAASYYFGHVVNVGSLFGLYSAGAPSANVTNIAPFTFAVSDQININFVYQAS